MYRTEFNRMIADAKAGKIDLIITKSVSRFARNVEHFLQAVHSLADHSPRIGVFFESENIFSLKEDSQMLLSFQATMAEQESRNKSRSMETSLRMRLDHGLPLTPKLLGFQHDADGKLNFIRISNSESINLKKVRNFDLSFTGTVCVVLSDGSKTYASRRYVTRLKGVLGI